jgi:hypothetical protein
MYIVNPLRLIAGMLIEGEVRCKRIKNLEKQLKE